LLQACKDILHLDYPDEKGVSLRSKLEQAWKSTGYKVKDPLLDKELLIPIEAKHLWDWFWDLRSGVGGGGFGPSPINHREIVAWSFNMGIYLNPWEINTIRDLDNCYMEYVNEELEKRSKKKNK
jgi:hypothetical protein